MIRNYFLIAWRSLKKNRVYSAINISGLAIGMGVVLLISLWMLDELNYNKGFATYDRVVRVMINQTHGNDTRTNYSIPLPLAAELQTRYGGDFKKVSAGSWNSSHILVVGDKQLSKNGMFVQPEMMDILALRTLDGRKAVLDDPTSILINQSLAKAMFGTSDAEGKIVKFDDSTIFKVGGVFADLPYNSDFRETNYFAPWANYASTHPWVKEAVKYWNQNAFQAFALLQDRADLNQVGAKVKGALNGHERTDKPEVLLFPMSRWHLYADYVGGKNVGGAIQFVRMFAIIGVFVLLLACINFMNLSTARSEKRAKEVGIRKSVGSLRGQLIGQFLGESIFIALLAFALSLLLVEMALPWFNGVADKQMHIFWNSPLFWALALGGTLLAGLIAGSYPAFYLSSFNPVKALKGSFRAGRWAALPRQVLTVLQFTVSVALIVGTVIVFQQILFVKNRPVGYTREGLITIDIINQDLPRHYDALRQELLGSGAVANVAESSSPTTNTWNNQSGFDWAGKDPNLSPSFAVIWGTGDFGATVGWQFVAGRDFSPDFPSDSTALILNETAVKYMGLKNPIGATVKYLYSARADKNYHVIGVIRDMVMDSPFGPPKQSVFILGADNNANVITVKINPNMAVSKALPAIGSVFKKYNPGAPFEYNFNDAVYAMKFELEDRIGKLAGFFTVFAIFISCLGLFGLASFMAEQRVKEIGVRKILGASVFRLWGLLSRDFVLLVGLSFFIALPLAGYVMSGWLRHYPYRVTISAWVFVGTMATAMLITLVTVSFQGIRAAMANPVRSLRAE
ncbi:MAG TPA: ABC transporter permease [Puia sp.]|jgi:ABC-type antimicrobial peptide transport system permease subunit|nr:ABC transporter permease [Puia sp.]